jgi:TATA-box binding protein (TBP) (component of TFIID and TFIIIB)
MEIATPYRVSTITCNASITTTIDLVKLFENIHLKNDATDNNGFIWIENGLKKRGTYPKKRKETKEKKCFDNQITVIYKYAEGYYPNLKIFRNGNIQMTGIRTEDDGKKIVDIITNELKTLTENCVDLVGTKDNITNCDFTIRMINCDFGIPFKIRRKNLHQLLISPKYGNTCSFQPLTYPGVKLQYYWNRKQNNKGICQCNGICYGKGNGNGDGECKKVTIAIFDSGKILITGANSFEQVDKAYEFICEVVMDNKEELKKSFTT